MRLNRAMPALKDYLRWKIASAHRVVYLVLGSFM